MNTNFELTILNYEFMNIFEPMAQKYLLFKTWNRGF